MDDATFEVEQLHFAAQDGDTARVKALLLAGFDPNAFDELGNTPLHYAAAKESFDTVKALLAAGADVNAICDRMAGNAPLGDVAQTCSLEMAKLLLAAGADPELPGHMQMTALHRAINRKRGDGPKVYELLRQHAAKKRV